MGDDLTEGDRIRLRNLEVKHDELTRAVEENTSAVRNLSESTRALVEIWKASGTLLMIVTSVGKFLVACGVIAASVKAFFMFSKGGGGG